jgi:hypothetical protein
MEMINIFEFNSRESYFKAIFEELIKKENRRSLNLTRAWAKQFEKYSSGVYFIFENDDLKYVGETGSLYGRMLDLLNTKNHNLRRALGEKFFSSEEGYLKATSRSSFIPEIEKKLNDYIIENLSVSCITIEIGRKEFEEWVTGKNSELLLYNIRKKRKTNDSLNL